ncbi:hypothetical protein PILCRDRAFT_328288 [Piloderma croceum F 1598]|uniref:Ricin B lectin domain-containing protein n=1 Tax=Piloderma croceum (strain F 1598) TaxID=765440 RepID=A0A0C3BHS3_PILCF|nr:hypothetical protein PILCRDRAFT_328288 [Piloderma croceum F 1598]
MMLSSMISLALSFLALTSATPLNTRGGTCKPAFGGPPGFKVNIFNNAVGKEWHHASPPSIGTQITESPKSLSPVEFRVLRLSSGEYSIQPIGYPGFRVASTALGKLKIVATKPSDSKQLWNIDCGVCGTPTTGQFDQGCVIQSVDNPSLCVQSSPTTISLKPCGGTHQKYSFAGA